MQSAQLDLKSREFEEMLDMLKKKNYPLSTLSHVAVTPPSCTELKEKLPQAFMQIG